MKKIHKKYVKLSNTEFIIYILENIEQELSKIRVNLSFLSERVIFGKVMAMGK